MGKCHNCSYNPKRLVFILAAVIGFLVSLAILKIPRPIVIDDDLYAVKRTMADHLKFIADRPHSVMDIEAHENVKNYIIDRLNEYVGTENVEVREYHSQENRFDLDYKIINILAVIKGESDVGVLVASHYDSGGVVSRYSFNGNSFGAADDGYGVTVMLDIAKTFGKTQGLKNTLYLLFTDAEEVGLDGSKAEVKNHPELFENINLVINMEARGIKGPAIMFETNTNNYKTMQLYKKTKSPFSLSEGTAIYGLMPNSTDLSTFKKIGDRDIASMNFAVLESLYHYHEPRDNYEHVNFTSLLHYRDQVLPILEEYLFDEKYSDMHYFDSDCDSVFFMIFPRVMVEMSAKAAIALEVISVLLLAALLGIYIKIIKISWKRLLANIGWILLTVIAVVIYGLALAAIIACYVNRPYSLTGVNTSFDVIPYVLSFALVATGVWLLIKHFMKTDNNRYELILAGIILNILISFVLVFILSGVSILFFWPAFILEIILLIHAFIRNNASNIVFFGINVFWFVLYYYQIFHVFYFALTLGALPVDLALFVLIISMLVPTFMIKGQPFKEKQYKAIPTTVVNRETNSSIELTELQS